MSNLSGVNVMRSVESRLLGVTKWPSVVTEASDFLRLRLFFLRARKGDIATSIIPKCEEDATEERPLVALVEGPAAGDGGANDLEHWAHQQFGQFFIIKLT